MSARTRPPGRILIIHEEPFFGALLKVRLERRGFLVTLAFDEQGFRQEVFSSKPDLILLGDKLKNRASCEAYDWLLAMGLDRNIPIVHLSGFTESKPGIPARAGRRAALYKRPFDSRGIAGDIEAFMRG